MPVDAFFTGFSPLDARGLGQEVFEVLFSSWGQRVANADPKIAFANLQFPQVGEAAVPMSLAGVAFGPRSTVDRCWISYDRQKPFNNTLLPGTPDRVRRVSVGSPLVFTQAGELGTIGTTNNPNDACTAGLLYVFPHTKLNPNVTAQIGPGELTTMLPDHYLSGLDGTTSLPFGQATVFEAPYLHLYLFIKPLRFLPGPRFPMQRQGQAAFGAGTRSLMASYPIFGRTRVRLAFNSTINTKYEIGLLRGLNEIPADNQEIIAVTKTGATPQSIDLDFPCADYINIYGTPDGAGTVNFWMTALDELGFT